MQPPKSDAAAATPKSGASVVTPKSDAAAAKYIAAAVTPNPMQPLVLFCGHFGDAGKAVGNTGYRKSPKVRWN